MTKPEKSRVPGQNPASGDETHGLPKDSPPGGLPGIPFIEHWNRRPARGDGSGLCDFMIVIEYEVLLFTEVEGLSAEGKNPEVSRDAAARWKKEALDPALEALRETGELIRAGEVFEQNTGKLAFRAGPGLAKDIRVYRFAVVRGGLRPEDAGAEFSVSYGDPARGDDGALVRFDRNDPSHVLGPGVLRKLGSILDFLWYAEEKEAAIGRHDFLACGTEEDLLALYLEGGLAPPKSEGGKRGALVARSGLWEKFRESPGGRNLEKRLEASRPWEDLERRAWRSALERAPDFDAVSPWRISSPAYIIAVQPLALRPTLSKKMLEAMETFDEASAYEFRISQPEPDPETCYVFMQTRRGGFKGTDEDYRKLRLERLEMGCGMAKNEIPRIQTAVGVAREVPGPGADVEDEFILFDCSEWGENERILYDEKNLGGKFLPGEDGRPVPREEPAQGTLFPLTRLEALAALGDAAREGRRLLAEKGPDARAGRGRWAETVGPYIETVFGLRGGGRNLLSEEGGMKEIFVELSEIYGLDGGSPRHVFVSGDESRVLLRKQIEIVESTILGLGGTLPERAKPGKKPKKRRAKRPKSARPKKKKSRKKKKR